MVGQVIAGSVAPVVISSATEDGGFLNRILKFLTIIAIVAGFIILARSYAGSISRARKRSRMRPSRGSGQTTMTQPNMRMKPPNQTKPMSGSMKILKVTVDSSISKPVMTT